MAIFRCHEMSRDGDVYISCPSPEPMTGFVLALPCLAHPRFRRKQCSSALVGGDIQSARISLSQSEFCGDRAPQEACICFTEAAKHHSRLAPGPSTCIVLPPCYKKEDKLESIRGLKLIDKSSWLPVCRGVSLRSSSNPTRV